jgi:hypothetical protein
MKAFPITETWDDPSYYGMDLRDYFASHAMQAFLSRTDTPLVINKKDISLFAYLMADAMMKSREK